MFLSFVNLLLSPIGFVIFIFFSASHDSFYFEKLDSNTKKLKVVPYIIFNLGFVFSILLITYFLDVVLEQEIVVWEVYQPKYFWLSIASWLVTAFTIKSYFKGIEGNIMGFIFFPLLLVSSSALVIANVSDIYGFMDTIEAPVIELNLWIRLVVHSFLPFYIYLFINIPDQKGKTDKGWFETIFGSLFFQLIFFGFNRLIIYFWGSGLTFSQFLGEGQSILYYMPMIGGVLYFISESVITYKNCLVEGFKQLIVICIVPLMILQLFNYVQLIKSCF